MANSESSPALRLTALAVVVAVLFVGLIARLWFLQVLAGDRYAALADSNAVQTVLVEPPRGRILDRNGEELVANRVAHTISADRNALLAGDQPKDEAAEEVLRRLSDLLRMPVDDIITELTSPRYSPFRPSPIMTDVAPEVVFAIEENAELFPGVVAERLPVREYPRGELAAHVLGYVGEISGDQLEDDRYVGYRPGDVIGQTGIEDGYEQELQGTEGWRQLQVNARGAVLREVASTDPVPGNDLVTTIDADLQADVERILAEGIEASRTQIHSSSGRPLASPSGAAVVMDPRNGEILALASYPSYDPREFIGGASTAWYQDIYEDIVVTTDEDGEQIIEEDPDPQPKAGINRAISSQSPPGSTWKIVSGLAALQAGQITPDSTVDCPAVWRFGKRNWNFRSEGHMDLATALKRSCDTFFYEVAFNHWLVEERQVDQGETPDEVYQRVAAEFGFGAPLGIELAHEQSGTVPDRAWKQERWERSKDRWCRLAEEYTPGTFEQRLMEENCVDGWRLKGGDVANISIGQGDVTVTPLQLASAYATVANGGTVWWPHLGREIVDATTGQSRPVEPEALNVIEAPEAYWRELQYGLEQVVMGSRGTAVSPFSGFPLDEIPVAGKTGTAEACCDKLPFSWFASYAPADDPQYVVVVTVDEGGGGSQTSAPIVRRIHEAIFDLPISDFVPGPANVLD